MLTIKEIRKLKPEELAKELKKAQLKKTHAAIELRTSQDKKSHTHEQWKRYCAQIMTVRNETINSKEKTEEEKKS